PLLEHHNPEIICNVVYDVLQNTKPALFLMGHTFLGIETGPVVATRLGVCLVSNCVELEFSDGEFAVTRPVFGGTAHAKEILLGPQPHVVTLQKGRLTETSLMSGTATVENIPVQIDESSLRTSVIETIEASTEGIDITKADIIVAVGRGIGGKANIQQIEDLASSIGGVTACSRPVVDFGWLPLERLVGMSGKTVKPRVYLACGISGASQHVAGMTDSKVIIAINKDRNAPIFQVAHYGVAGDLFKIIGQIKVE
ncbi:electron transfer flavoprotein subunit alpha/FixB family protein, partial [Chloroflexota bacterium]